MHPSKVRQMEQHRMAREEGRKLLGDKCKKCGARPKPKMQLRWTHDGQRRKRQFVEVSQLEAHHVDPATSTDMFRYLGRAGWLPLVQPEGIQTNDVTEQLSKLVLLCTTCHTKLHQLLGKT
jgi:hypothetical protein